MENITVYIYYGMLISAYIILAMSFSGVKKTGKILYSLSVLFPLCGILQMLSFDMLGKTWTLILYPVTVHFLIFLYIVIVHGRKPVTALAAVTTAYMICQPSRWAGVLATTFSDSIYTETVVRTAAVILIVTVGIRYFSGVFSEVFGKNVKDVLIFSIVPVTYYLMDYAVYLYTGIWKYNNYMAAELAPVIICIVYMLFCSVYYKGYEEKAEIERRSHIVQIINEQQEREIESITDGFNAIKKLREDINSFYDSIELPLDSESVISAGKELEKITEGIDCSAAPAYTESVILNYMLARTKEKCRKYNIEIEEDIDVKYLKGDETILTTVISNVLGNALKEQLKLPEDRRSVSIRLVNEDSRLIFSVSNPYNKKPEFDGGIPYDEGRNRGYGTGGIAYLTEMMGGRCYFSAGEEFFTVKITI